VVDAVTVLVTHLGEIVRRHAHELLSREDLKSLIDKVRETAPAVVDELIPNVMTTGALHRILVMLLEERVPISNLTRILESLANHAMSIKDPIELTERVRLDIGRSICDRFRDPQRKLRAILVDPRLDVELRKSLVDRQLHIEPSKLEQLILRLASELQKAAKKGIDVVLLCDSALRRPLRQALARSLNELSIIAYQEIPSDFLMEPVAFLRPEDLAGPPTAPAPIQSAA